MAGQDDAFRFMDPFLMGSTLRFANNENESGFASNDLSDDDPGNESEDQEGPQYTFVESVLQDGGEQELLRSEDYTDSISNTEEDEAAFADLTVEEAVQKQFIFQQAKIEGDLRMQNILEMISSRVGKAKQFVMMGTFGTLKLSFFSQPRILRLQFLRRRFGKMRREWMASARLVLRQLVEFNSQKNRKSGRI